MKVSIITTTYNSAATIRQTIESVQAQDYPEIEHILIDGASTDHTMLILEEYADGIACVLSEPDMGIYDGMNKGIRMATGDIIGILNSDDFYTSPDVIRRIVAVFLDLSVDGVYGDVQFVSPDNLSCCVRYYSSHIFRCSLMRLGFMPAHPSFYVRRSCYERLGLYKPTYKICADFELLLRFLFVNRICVRYLPRAFVTMRLGGVSTEGVGRHWLIMKEHLRAFRENGLYTNILLLSLRYLYKLTEFFCRNKKE